MASETKCEAEALISEFLIIENQIKLLLESWSNSPLIPFKLSFSHPDDSKSHWDKANTLKIDIQKIETQYQKILSTDNMRNSNDEFLNFFVKNYEEFLNAKNLFNKTIAEKEINLGLIGNILNSWYKEKVSALAIASFDVKSKETTLFSNKVKKNNNLCSNGTSTSVIALPNSEVFCNAPNHSYEYFIMNSSHSKRHIPDIKTVYDEGLVYFENNVFAFGGNNGFGSVASAKKYNLSTNKWEILALLPKTASSCACIVYKQNILISGFMNESLCQYDTKIHSYSLIFNKLGERNKVLLSFDSKVYIIEGLGGIYESERENQYKFTFIRKNNLNWLGSGQRIGVYTNDCAYFSMWNENHGINYYSFDVKTKKIAFIKEFPWYRHLHL